MCTRMKNGWLRFVGLLPRCLCLSLMTVGVAGVFFTPAFGQLGSIPVPVLDNVEVQAAATFDVGTGLFTYTYSVTNPSSNTGEIRHLALDVTTRIPRSGVPAFDSSGLTMPRGAAGLVPFDEKLADLEPLSVPAGTSVIPFGQLAPSDWAGGLRLDGFAGFSTLTKAARILPGMGLGGFELISRGMPTILEMQIKPFWLFTSPGDPTPEEIEQATEIEASIILHTVTLGPSALTPGTFAHWDRLREDLNQAIQLGWIPDVSLANALVSQLASAREALDSEDGTLAKARLQTLIDTISQSTPAQRRPEVEALIRLNAEQLIEATPDTPIPFEPQTSLSPESTTLPLGTQYTLTATVVNLGDPANPPVPDFELGFQVIEGPNQGLESSGVTNTQGQLSFSYTSTQVGTDKIVVGIPALLPAFHRPLRPPPGPHKILVGSVGRWSAPTPSRSLRTGRHMVLVNLLEFAEEVGVAEVTWSGGADLVVPLFIPPLIKSEGDDPVFVRDRTANIGSVASGPSITRYFFSEDPVVDPATDVVLGERSVPALQPGEQSESIDLTFSVPSGLPEGLYHLAACADAEGPLVDRFGQSLGAVRELDEENNCSFSQINTQSIVVPLQGAPVVTTFLVIDADSIDEGGGGLGVRAQLSSFAGNIGGTITLPTGEVGDEGWFALKTIPASWTTAGPTTDGLRNYVGNPSQPFPHNVGPGLGAGNDPEALLDEIPNVTPLRATGLKMLEGTQVCALVYGSDISINYDPLQGSLKGDNQGTVAFEVSSVTQSTGSSSALPEVEIQILDADEVCEGAQNLFTDAPEPTSSSEPFDVVP